MAKKTPGNKKTQEQFIKEVEKKFNGKYNTSLVEYKNALTPVTMSCPKHGEFSLKPNAILNPKKDWACPLCGADNKSMKLKKDIQVFKKQLHERFGEFVSLVDHTYYLQQQATFICKTHGEFTARPKEVLLAACPCPSCSPNAKKTTEHYISRAKEVHGDRYDYSLVEFVDTQTKVKIICKHHGVFEQTIHSHIGGRGCMKCSKPIHSQESFIASADSLHSGRYLYSEVVYDGCTSKVEIVCPIHGSFWQTPHSHVNNACGCPTCAVNSFSTADDGWLYVFKSENIVKVGITKQHYKNRLNNVRTSSGVPFKLAHLFPATGLVVKEAETIILEDLRRLYEGVSVVFDGSTECFITKDVDTIINHCGQVIERVSACQTQHLH